MIYHVSLIFSFISLSGAILLEFANCCGGWDAMAMAMIGIIVAIAALFISFFLFIIALSWHEKMSRTGLLSVTLNIVAISLLLKNIHW